MSFMNQGDLFMKKNKKNVFALLLALSLLAGCATNTTPSNSPDISTPSVNASNNLPSSDSSDTSKSSTDVESTTFTLEEANEALFNAVFVDEDFTEVRVSQYNNYNTYRQQRSTKISSYLDVTLYVGTTVNRDSNSIITATSNFREERTYNDGIYTQIKKFDTTFAATAYRYETDELEALINLNAGQGYNAWLILNTFTSNYDGRYFGEILSDGSRHATFIYTGEIDDDLYQYIAGFEFTIDAQYHVTDFWYTEGYYDTFYDNYDTPTSMRKHGVYGVGYSYFMESYKLGELTSYPFALQYSIEDNFITEASFSKESLTYSISETPEDEYGYKSVNLLELLITNPQIGDLVRGCPINNLSFSSSNSDVIVINDGWYADFIGEGEATITVYDKAYGVTGSNTLTITLLP